MEPLSTTFAKAVDDLSGKIFIPSLICSLLVELGPWLKHQTGLGLFPIYLIILAAGAIVATGIIWVILLLSIHLFDGRDIGPEIGVAIMPLGFAGLFPQQFVELGIPYSQVTGVAILAWAFMLVKGKQFFRGHFWEDH